MAYPIFEPKSKDSFIQPWWLGSLERQIQVDKLWRSMDQIPPGAKCVYGSVYFDY